MRLIGLAVVLTLSLTVAPLVAEGQQAGKVYRIGVLSPGTAPAGPLEALRQGLRELGYDEGRNITVEWRFSGATDEPLNNLAAELVRLKVDVIVAINTQASLAAKRATATMPIVITRVSDPVRTGLVVSFAHPGGNITGLSNFSDELSGKRLAVIRELMPAISRLAVLWNVGNPGIELSVREMARASTQFGIELHLHGVKSGDDLNAALSGIVRERAGALFVFDDVADDDSQDTNPEFGRQSPAARDLSVRGTHRGRRPHGLRSGCLRHVPARRHLCGQDS
jgi:putative ABC transport system substrate-binding protein